MFLKEEILIFLGDFLDHDRFKNFNVEGLPLGSNKVVALYILSEIANSRSDKHQPVLIEENDPDVFANNSVTCRYNLSLTHNDVEYEFEVLWDNEQHSPLSITFRSKSALYIDITFFLTQKTNFKNRNNFEDLSGLIFHTFIDFGDYEFKMFGRDYNIKVYIQTNDITY